MNLTGRFNQPPLSFLCWMVPGRIVQDLMDTSWMNYLRWMNQFQKAEAFRALHHRGSLLVLPNIWDILGALLLQDLGYPAIATASAAVAYSNGCNDGENFSFGHLLDLLARIAASVELPVTADVESGYANDDGQLYDNIKRLIAAGIVGINIEDTDKSTGLLFSRQEQVNRIRIIREAAKEAGIPLFINARTDVLLRGNFPDHASKMNEIIIRGEDYKNAGADCYYPITLSREEDIAALLSKLRLPVNILAMPGIPNLKDLQSMGVARVSLGPGFLKIAVQAMKQLATQLTRLDGLDAITQNEISSDYLKSLVAVSK